MCGQYDFTSSNTVTCIWLDFVLPDQAVCKKSPPDERMRGGVGRQTVVGEQQQYGVHTEHGQQQADSVCSGRSGCWVVTGCTVL